MPAPDLRFAICRRCRSEDRIARGADDEQTLLDAARAWIAERHRDMHVRCSQCLSCCDGGHTVRIEYRGTEVALVGVRTVGELEAVLEDAERLAARDIPPRWASRVYQVWEDGDLVWHRQLSQGADV